MTKAETRQLQIVRAYIGMLQFDTAARALSALIRATRSKATAQELHCFAVEQGLNTQPDYII